MTVANPTLASKVSDTTRVALVALLSEMEPNFNTALGQFDLVEAVRYTQWLRAVSNLRASAFNRQGAELILTRLSSQDTDPRKAMAYLASEEGSDLMNQIGQRARFESVVQRISLYSMQHPQNKDMRDIVVQVKIALSGLKG